ncbi:DUF3883 domain-containing protein [Sporosarcina sp. Te-1]|uniref:DUF3883 domain-containing protein n=1 Tax=Sporosarcina sp. Te-1 TaxID=2818390 RepID=UPI001A9D927E|nr:DUF3883 domain-containing protein [Sporosarcina sp. Te-1]QTD42798.1 DUF3883 domain-containing protein [Sporosarcina sp. Te-1]
MDLLVISKEELKMLSNEEFLKSFAEMFYAKDSFNTVFTAINKHVFKKIDKHFTDLKYDDYVNIQNNIVLNDGVKRFSNTLFKYLYLMGLVDVERFEGFPSKEKIERYFKDRATNKDRIRVPIQKEKMATLEIEDLLKVERFYSSDTKEIDELKMKFYWHILSEYDFKNKQILALKSDNFHDGELLIGDEIIELNEKFEYLFEHLKRLTNDGLSTMSPILKNLADKLSININLTPTVIRNTKLINTITCPNCQDSYSAELFNWCAIDGKLVCKDCGDTLKKIFTYQQLTNSPIEKVDNKQVYSNLEKNYEDEKKDIIKKGVDFRRLQEIMDEIGKLGEEYVYKVEYKKLIDKPFANLIDKTKADNPKNGYDILSYDLEGNEIFIEVKATSTLRDEFYISQNELETAEKLLKSGKKHYVYFVKDILSENPILTIIDNILNDDRFNKVGLNWKMTKEH